MSTYLLLNIVTIAVPLLLSFDKKVQFYKRWPALLPAILISGAVFIAWDVAFTHLGIWSFNPKHLIDINLFNLPLEEWLFFFTVPYACLFIYECFKVYNIRLFNAQWGYYISWGLVPVLLTIAYLNTGKLYTTITFSSTAIFLLLHIQLLSKRFLGHFFTTYLVHLVPFLIINGVLTAIPVVMYNDAQNLGLRLYSIPVEDTVYSMLLLLMNVTFYELLLRFRR